MKKYRYDIIIIGSGIGGLIVASLLSRTNKVLVLEKNSNFGGYCTDFKRGGFRFEVAIQAIDGLNKESVIWEILKKSRASKGLEFVRPKNLYRSIFPDYNITIPQGDFDKYVNSLFFLFPAEKTNIMNLFNVMKSIYIEMNHFFKGESFKKSPFLLRYYRKTLKDLLDEFIIDEKLKCIISQYWIYRGLPPSKLSCATFSYIWYDYTVNGSYFPKEGTRSIIRNLIATIKHNGGNALKSKEVFKLYLNKDRITELELKDGERIKSNIFISNVDIFKTFNMLKNGEKHLIEQFFNKIRSNAITISVFKIYLGLGIDVRDMGLNDYEIFINPGYNMDIMYQAALDNDFKNTPLSVTIYSNLTNAFCRKGHSVISIGTLSGYDFWKGLSKTNYEKTKRKMADLILSRCETILPGLTKYIKVKEVATPLTMERYTGNSKGSAYGWSKKSLMEEIRFMNPSTPIANLFLSSQWTKIGGGIAGVLLSSNRVFKLLNDKHNK